MTRQEIEARIKQLKTQLAASDQKLDPSQSWTGHLAQSAEVLKQIAELQKELKKLGG
jgi:uncharacterized membrane-anchored protein YhcB (DUF1043 family)